MAFKTNTTVSFEEFYDANGPDNAQQMLCLHKSLSDISDEELYKTVEVNRGKISYILTGPTGDELLLTSKSRDAFLKFIQSEHDKTESELDFDEAADYERAINNPHS